MSGYKTEQRRVVHRGREFHFVTYEGEVANPARLRVATEPAWYLMHAGKRWAVMPHQIGQETEVVERELTRWLDKNVFA